MYFQALFLVNLIPPHFVLYQRKVCIRFEARHFRAIFCRVCFFLGALFYRRRSSYSLHKPLVSIQENAVSSVADSRFAVLMWSLVPFQVKITGLCTHWDFEQLNRRQAYRTGNVSNPGSLISLASVFKALVAISVIFSTVQFRFAVINVCHF